MTAIQADCTTLNDENVSNLVEEEHNFASSAGWDVNRLGEEWLVGEEGGKRFQAGKKQLQCKAA
jgi:hypothetical protein